MGLTQVDLYVIVTQHTTKWFYSIRITIIFQISTPAISKRSNSLHSLSEPLTFSDGCEGRSFLLLQTNHLQSHKFPIHPGNNTQDTQSMLILCSFTTWNISKAGEQQGLWSQWNVIWQHWSETLVQGHRITTEWSSPIKAAAARSNAL